MIERWQSRALLFFRSMKPPHVARVIFYLCLSRGSHLQSNIAYGQKTDLDKLVDLSIEELANMRGSIPTKTSRNISDAAASVVSATGYATTGNRERPFPRKTGQEGCTQ